MKHLVLFRTISLLFMLNTFFYQKIQAHIADYDS